MLILQPHIFKEFPEIVFGFSTKFGRDNDPPYYFNLSLSVDDSKDRVINRRKSFFNSLGLPAEQTAFQRQVHGDKITFVSKGGNVGESDAMITDKTDIALCISTADCTGVFIYDVGRKIISAVHSGWRGTQKSITETTVKKLKTEYGCNPE